MKSSKAALTALDNARGHIARAVLELRQAERELTDVRGLGIMGPQFLSDVGVFRVLAEYMDKLSQLGRAHDAGLRLASETPEENAEFARAVEERITVRGFSVVEQTPDGPQTRFLAPFQPWSPSTPIPRLSASEACKACGGYGRLMDSGPPDHWTAACPDCGGTGRKH